MMEIVCHENFKLITLAAVVCTIIGKYTIKNSAASCLMANL